MKTLMRILIAIFSVVVCVAGLAFTFIEGRLIVSGDWLLFDSPIVGLMQYLIRLAVAVGGITVGVMAIARLKTRSVVVESAYLWLASIVIAIFASNGVGVYILLLASVYLLLNVLAVLMRVYSCDRGVKD